MPGNRDLYGDDPKHQEYSSVDAEPQHRTTHPLEKSSLVDVEVGTDGLPVKIKLAPRWKSSFDPSEYGMSIMNAYHFAIHQVIVGDAEGAYLPSSNLPPLREVASALLRTRTAEEYHALYADLYLVRQYTIFGPGYNRYDEPGLTVVASPSELLSITIDSEWSQTIAAEFIAQDIIDCCNQIRAKRPLIPADSTLDGKTHSEIAARLARHELRLLESEAW